MFQCTAKREKCRKREEESGARTDLGKWLHTFFFFSLSLSLSLHFFFCLHKYSFYFSDSVLQEEQIATNPIMLFLTFQGRYLLHLSTLNCCLFVSFLPLSFSQYERNGTAIENEMVINWTFGKATAATIRTAKMYCWPYEYVRAEMSRSWETIRLVKRWNINRVSD